MLLGDHGLLDGVHAAYRGTVGVVATIHVPGTHALEPSDLLRFLVVGQAHEMSARGTRRRQDALHFHGGDHVGMLGVAVGIELRRIERLEAGGQYDGTHVEFHDFVLHGVVDRVHAAKLGADLAFAGLEMHADVPVDGRRVGHGLRIGHVDGLAALEPHVVFRADEFDVFLFGDFGFDFIQSDMSGGTDRSARAAGQTRFGEVVVRRVHLHVHASPGQLDGAGAHSFAHAHAETAENAGVVLGLEPGFLDAVFLGHFLQQRNAGAPCQKHLDDQLAALVNRFAVREDLHAFPDGIVAGGDEARTPSVEHLHGADTAHSGGFQRLVMAQGRDLHAVFVGDLQNILAFFSLDRLAVELECNHDYCFSIISRVSIFLLHQIYTLHSRCRI